MSVLTLCSFPMSRAYTHAGTIIFHAPDKMSDQVESYYNFYDSNLHAFGG